MPQDIVLSSDDLDELLEQARGQITKRLIPLNPV